MKWLCSLFLLLPYQASQASLKCVDLFNAESASTKLSDIPFKNSHTVFQPTPNSYKHIGAEVNYKTSKVSGSGVVLGVKWTGTVRIFDFNKQKIVEINAATIPKYEISGTINFVTRGNAALKLTQKDPTSDIFAQLKPGSEVIAILGAKEEHFIHGNIESVVGHNISVKDPVTGNVSIFDLQLFKKFELIVLSGSKNSSLLKIPESNREPIRIYDAFTSERRNLLDLWNGRSNIYQEPFYLDFFLKEPLYAKILFSKWYDRNTTVKDVSEKLGWPLSTIFLDPSVGFHIGSFKRFTDVLSSQQLQNHTPDSLRDAFSAHLGTVTLFRAQVESINSLSSDITSPLFFQDPMAQRKKVEDLLFPVANEHLHTSTPREDAARKLSNQDSTYISAATPEHIETAKIATTWFTGDGRNLLLDKSGFSLFLYEFTIPKLYAVYADQIAPRSQWPQYIKNNNGHKIDLEAEGVEMLIPFVIPAHWVVSRSQTAIPEEYTRVR